MNVSLPAIQKLFGWYGGHGLSGTAGSFDSLGPRPGNVHAHHRDGVWTSEGGYEYNLVLVAAAFCVACTGAGE